MEAFNSLHFCYLCHHCNLPNFSNIPNLFYYFLLLLLLHQVHFLCLFHLRFFHLLHRHFLLSLIHLLILLYHPFLLFHCLSSFHPGVSMKLLIWILLFHQLQINKHFVLNIIKEWRNYVCLFMFYIHCFSSLDGSIATTEIKTSAQIKETKIIDFVFIFDQLRLYCS